MKNNFSQKVKIDWIENKFSLTPTDLFPKNVCELEVTYKRSDSLRVKISKSEEVVTFARTHFYTKEIINYCERFFVIFLDRSSNAFAYKQMSMGGMSGTVVDTRLIFQTALLAHSTSIILLHNHPSGNFQPSNSDIQLTKNLCQAGKFLEIRVLDHVILTEDSHFSFADEGLIP